MYLQKNIDSKSRKILYVGLSNKKHPSLYRGMLILVYSIELTTYPAPSTVAVNVSSETSS